MKGKSTARVGSLGSWLRRAFTENLALKALSLALAIGLSAYQRGSRSEQQRTVPVDVVLRLPPAEANRELMTLVPPSIHVTVRGSMRSLDRLIQNGVPPVEVDLRSGISRAITFREEDFSMPPGVSVNIVDPALIELKWEDVISRKVPIQSSMTGQVADGYVVESSEVSPSEIELRGPASLVEVQQFVRLAPFDVSGKRDGVFRHLLRLDPPPQRVQYVGPASATVTVTIKRQLARRKLAKQPVTVIGLPRAEVHPPRVDITLTGLPEVINELRDEVVVPRVIAHVDSKEQRHGSSVLPVNVDLANVQVEVQPPTVSVTW